MDAGKAKRIAETAAVLLDERLGREGFARIAPRNTGKSYHLQWERRSAWRRDLVELVRRYAVPSFFAQVHVDVLLADGAPVPLHGESVSYFLHGSNDWPSLLQSARLLGSESRYAEWIAGECVRALAFFVQAQTPENAAAWAQTRDRNGAMPGTPQHARLVERLAGLTAAGAGSSR